MKTLEEIFNLVENMNEEAHQGAWNTWILADELEESEDESDWEVAEDKREEASLEQASYFREAYWLLDDEDREAINHWLKEDRGFLEQFIMWFGEEEYRDQFE